jgi:hypothetical protein
MDCIDALDYSNSSNDEKEQLLCQDFISNSDF